MFSKVTSQKLREVSQVLAEASNDPALGEKPQRFAACLSVLMRCELAERGRKDDSTE